MIEFVNITELIRRRKKVKLYEISDDIRQAAKMVNDGDMSQEDMADTFEALGIEFDKKLQSIAAYVREMELDAESLDSEIKRLQAKKKAVTNEADRLKGYMRHEMEKAGKTKVIGKLFNITLGKPSQVIETTGDLPEKYKTFSFDKKAAKADLIAGIEVKNACLVQGKARLIIK